MRAILTYHSIDPSGSVISTPASAFRRHVAWLATSQVRVVGLGELLALPTDADAVALTFDDGFANFRDLAAPLLAEHGFTATIFVVSGRVGGTNAWEPLGGAIPVLPLLSWEDLGALLEAGFEVGAHTRTHPRLTALAGADVRAEVAGSADDIRRELGVAPASFAYPFGTFDDAVEGEARACFTLVCTTELDVVGADAARTRLPRLDMYYYRDPGRIEAWGTARFRRHLAMRRAGRSLRARLRREA